MKTTIMSWNVNGIEKIQSLLDLIIRKAISIGAFSTPANVAIDEHDHPYYGADRINK